MNHFFKITNVDLTQSGSISLHELTQDYMCLYIVIEIVNKSGVTGSCSFSVGTNSPDYDDVIAMQGIWHGDIEASDIVSFNSTNSKKKLLNNEELFLNIASPFNGTCTANVYGIGFDPNATPSY